VSVAVTKPGYYLVTGTTPNGQYPTAVAGVVKIAAAGLLPNAESATFVGGKDVNQALLHQAIQAKAVWLDEVGGASTKQIATAAQLSGRALYSAGQAGVQATDDLYLVALVASGGVAGALTDVTAGGAAAGGAAAAGTAAEAAGGTAAGGAAAAGTAAEAAGGTAASGTAAETATAAGAGGGAGAGASKLASAAAGAGKDALTAAGIGAVLLATGLWKGVALVLAGAVLLLLALKGATGVGVPGI
jgi:hypothetical protein